MVMRRPDNEPLVAPAARAAGFTLVELLVVMTIIGLLLSIAAPRYIGSVGRAKEAALQTNLRQIREAIDKHRADTGRYPASLQQLVEARYLRALPMDPVTDSATSWILVTHPDSANPGVYDIRSGASGNGQGGTPYAAW